MLQSSILTSSQVSRTIYDVIHTRQVWHCLAQGVSKTRPLALPPFSSLFDLDVSQLIRLVLRTINVDEVMSELVITPSLPKTLFTLSEPVLFSQALPGGRYILLAFEKGGLVWWDTITNRALARHYTDGGLILMRRVALDISRHEFVLGLVYANPDICEQPCEFFLIIGLLQLSCKIIEATS